jgi:hypothetical protein
VKRYNDALLICCADDALLEVEHFVIGEQHERKTFIKAGRAVKRATGTKRVTKITKLAFEANCPTLIFLLRWAEAKCSRKGDAVQTPYKLIHRWIH